MVHLQERLLEAGYRRSISDESSSFWPSFIVGDTLRNVFQNLLLESNEEILQCSERVWNLLTKVSIFLFNLCFTTGWSSIYHFSASC